MPIRILVLCLANVVRSPFIVYYLDYLYRTSGLADKMDLIIESSGVEGKLNYPVHPRALAKGRELGFDMSDHRSRHANLKKLAEQDIILITHMRQQRRFKEQMPQLLHKVHHIFDFGRDHEVDKSYDMDDPSQLYDKSKVNYTEEDEIKAFNEFFEIVIPETQRIWEFLKEKYLESVKNRIPFDVKLFERAIPMRGDPARKYNFFTRFTFALCPYCQSRRLKRNKRRGFIQRRILPFFNGYPYHCGRCKRDFILFIGSQAFERSDSQRKKMTWLRFIESNKTESPQIEMPSSSYSQNHTTVKPVQNLPRTNEREVKPSFLEAALTEEDDNKDFHLSEEKRNKREEAWKRFLEEASEG